MHAPCVGVDRSAGRRPSDAANSAYILIRLSSCMAICSGRRRFVEHNYAKNAVVVRYVIGQEVDRSFQQRGSQGAVATEANEKEAERLCDTVGGDAEAKSSACKVFVL